TFPVRILRGKAFGNPPDDDVHLNNVLPVLLNHDLIVLGGWAEPSYLLLWALAQLSGKRVAFWMESTREDLTRPNWKESLKKFLLAHSVGVVAASTRAAEYCELLGMPRGTIFYAPNAVNTAYFRHQAAMLVPQRAALRRELGMDRITILFVGRMVEFFKNVSTLLRAQQILENRNVPIELRLIGEGPDRRAYEAFAQELKLRHVRFENFMAHDTLCCFYAAADVFVLPSRSETWGFVLNEAMEFGLPIVVSNAVGAAPDLVCDGVNGFVVPPMDASALALRLEELTMNSALRERMGIAARQHIAAFTPDAWADGFTHALKVMSA